MVNVPPIPPLLCSTPPPIDFGEDDEDVDVLPPTLDAVVDDDFGDFLAVDDGKSNEPLPSPRPSSLCDLPVVSIYDGLIPPDEEDLTNHTLTTATSSSSITDVHHKDSKTSINVTEAFNFNVKNTNGDIRNTSTEDNEDVNNKTLGKEISSEVLDTQENNLKPNNTNETFEISNPPEAQSTHKNLKDLTIDTSNIETKQYHNKANIACMQNMVSIEDLEDDLSDDELYSPKIPKNFVETDNLNDYFKIEEIKNETKAVNEERPISKDIDLKSLNKNESVLLENDDLQDDTTNILEGDDDFGEFADFQDFNSAITPAEQNEHFVNNTVPADDIKNKQLNNNEIEFNDFIDYNKINGNNIHEHKSEMAEIRNEKHSQEGDNKFEQLTSHSLNADDKLENNFNQNSEDLQTKYQDSSNEKCYEDLNKEVVIQDSTKNSMIIENVSINDDSSFGDFSSTANTMKHEKDNEENDDFGNFAEFPQTCENLEKENVKLTNTSSQIMEDPQKSVNLEDDFADFESHTDTPQIEGTPIEESKQIEKSVSSSAIENIEKDDDDDDFGDFNTAQPVVTTASSLTQTSQNTTIAPTTLPLTHNLNERISKILQLMFTSYENHVDEKAIDANEPKTRKIQDIPFTSIDSAKALEYQWLNSDTRHSFIKSLGIDSRNILFGENWNPSLPRFAANLSFNPLKPMKPVQASGSSIDCTSTLETISSNNNIESSNPLEKSVNHKSESLDLDCKASNTTEQTTEAFEELTLNSSQATAKISATTTLPYVPTEPPPPTSLKIFENQIDNEEKFSKTPPISEMESVTTFSSPLPTTNTIEMVLQPSPTQIHNNLHDFDLKDVEENLKNSLNINEVVVTSTFTGSFKETHIYTPPKSNDFEIKHSTTTSTSSSSPTKTNPIDFDYEKAAMGVIIDETVVKKEYRDVEYNPPFTLESLTKTSTVKTDMYETNTFTNTNASILSANDIKKSSETSSTMKDEQESNDDFSEFQSVTNNVNVPLEAHKTTSSKEVAKPLDLSKNSTVSHGGMILSPAILIPQAISMENQKPKIEWGDSTASINPEEMARIEELFPEPKSLKASSSSNGSNSSQKSTPTHQVASTPSISATVANKELGEQINNVNKEDDDDDWSDFVSVTVTNNMATNRSGVNNNILTKSPMGSPFKQRSPVVTHRMTHNNSNNDDEWSDFVSSAPPSAQQPAASYRVPQFNSGAWQNANFYNNPLSMYHKGPINMATPPTHPSQKSLYNNNNNYNISKQPYQIANNVPPVMMGNNQQQQMHHNAYQQQHQHHQQQIHVMQNFSTAPVPTPERLAAAAAAAKNNQFQSIGSAKVAPSIALIPDLGFVAPAIPTHTSFINSLPKPSINTKK